MQQEKNKTKASPAAAREGCHFGKRFPARWEKPPKGPFDERDGQQLEAHPPWGFQCRKPPRSLKCKDVCASGATGERLPTALCHLASLLKTLLPTVWHTPSCGRNVQSQWRKCMHSSNIWLMVGKILIISPKLDDPPLPIHGNRNQKGNGWLSYKPNSLSPMTKKEAGSDKRARMQWWRSWHSPGARNFRRALLPATVWQREVERIGPVAAPIPQHLCEELFLQSPRRTICSCLLDHAGSSATFQQINLCIFEIKEGADKSREMLWETGGVTISKLPLTPSTNQKVNLLP